MTMKITVICTPMAPALTLSEGSALALLDPGNDLRILQGGCSALVLSSLTGEEWNRILRDYPQLLDITADRRNPVFGVEFDNEGPGSVLDDRGCFRERGHRRRIRHSHGPAAAERGHRSGRAAHEKAGDGA